MQTSINRIVNLLIKGNPDYNVTNKLNNTTSLQGSQIIQQCSPVLQVLVLRCQLPPQLLRHLLILEVFGVELVVPVKQMVVGIILPKLFEEKPAPYTNLLERGHLLQLVNVTLFVVHVERVQVVASQAGILQPTLHRLPNTRAVHYRFSLLFLYGL